MSKMSINELAIFGGPPLFNETLHVGRPNIGNREKFIKYINDMFDRRWLSNNGPFVQQLEQKLAELWGVKHALLLCNATIALEITARALGLQGEVILPSFTFIASAHALQWQGITPVFCDVDPITHNIDYTKIENLITSRTTAILGVHVWGRTCDVENLSIIAQKHNLKLIFDAAHAFGCTHHGQMIGRFGEAEVFSFHATKFFNTFEGGAIATNNEALAEKIRSMRNFGFVDLDDVREIGTNGKMSEVSAAMGLISLESLDDFISINRKNFLAYSKNLENIPGIQLVKYNEKERNNYQYIVIEVDENTGSVNRDLMARILHAENIFARRYFYPGCHQMEPYRSNFPGAGRFLPETEKLTQRVLQLPTGTTVKEKDIRLICKLISFIILNAPDISARISGQTS